MLADYGKSLDNWDSSDFYELNMSMQKLFDDYYSYGKIIEIENGYNIFKYICKDEIVRIYKLYHVLNADIHTIGSFLEKKEIGTRKVYKLL